MIFRRRPAFFLVFPQPTAPTYSSDACRCTAADLLPTPDEDYGGMAQLAITIKGHIIPWLRARCIKPYSELFTISKGASQVVDSKGCILEADMGGVEGNWTYHGIEAQISEYEPVIVDPA